MNFRYLQLFFPLLVALHNAEEAVGMPKWTQRPGPWFGGVRPAVLRFSLAVLTSLALVTTMLSAISGRTTFWGDITFGYMVAMLFNAIVPHIAVSIFERTLMPGVMTAVLLNLPALSYLIVLALKQGYVSGHDALVSAIVVPFFLLLMIPLLFRLGEALGL
jgi:hypothetical protein